MVLRDTSGGIIFTSCRHLFTCDNALAAELEACREGIVLALEWSTLPFIIETDSTEAAEMISNPSGNRSQHAAIIQEIAASMRGGREIVVKAIRRGCNLVSHHLAQLGRCEMKTAVWLWSGTERVVNLC
ncbi:hypothetical protein ZWY2020_049473 [Hordeum vulgare]|nr:hypothetical protein ZWY2020_049473 [Hordeum vulgare]